VKCDEHHVSFLKMGTNYRILKPIRKKRLFADDGDFFHPSRPSRAAAVTFPQAFVFERA